MPRHTHATAPPAGAGPFASAAGRSRARDVEARAPRAQRPLERALPFRAGRGVAREQHRATAASALVERAKRGPRSRPATRASPSQKHAPSARRPRRSEAPPRDGRARSARSAATPLPDGVALSCPGFGAVDQRLVIVAREEEAAVVAILELREQHVGELAGPVKSSPGSASAGARPARRAGTRSRRGTRSDRARSPLRVASSRPSRQTVSRSASAAREREVGPARLVERTGRAGEPRDRERVPCRQDLVVPARAHALRARREQRCLAPAQARWAASGSGMPRSAATASSGARDAQMPGMPFEVRRPSSPKCGAATAHSSADSSARDFVARPDVELALLAFAVGIVAREEGAVRRAHARASASRRCRARRRRSAARPSRARSPRTGRAAGRCRRASSRSAGSSTRASTL